MLGRINVRSPFSPSSSWTANKRSFGWPVGKVGRRMLPPSFPPGSSSRSWFPQTLKLVHPLILYYRRNHNDTPFLIFSFFSSSFDFFLLFLLFSNKDTYYQRWRWLRVLLVLSSLSHRVRVQLILFFLLSPRSCFCFAIRGLFASSTCPMSHLRLARRSIPMLTRKSLHRLQHSALCRLYFGFSFLTPLHLI